MSNKLIEIRKNASPQERAMSYAENAKRVQLSESGKFKMMEFTELAMNALSECHHSDRVIVDMVRSKIGEAQRRFGF